MKKNLTTKLVKTGAATAAFFSQLTVLAQAQLDKGLKDLGDDVGAGGAGNTLPQFVGKLINFFLLILGLIAVVMLVYGGFLYVTSNGDEGKIESATKTITYAIIGLVVAFAAALVVRFVVNRLTEIA